MKYKFYTIDIVSNDENNGLSFCGSTYVDESFIPDMKLTNAIIPKEDEFKNIDYSNIDSIENFLNNLATSFKTREGAEEFKKNFYLFGNYNENYDYVVTERTTDDDFLDAFTFDPII